MFPKIVIKITIDYKLLNIHQLWILIMKLNANKISNNSKIDCLSFFSFTM